MRDFFRSPLFRCLVCLILVCCILVNVSPIRAKAFAGLSASAMIYLLYAAAAGAVIIPSSIAIANAIGTKVDEEIEIRVNPDIADAWLNLCDKYDNIVPEWDPDEWHNDLKTALAGGLLSAITAMMVGLVVKGGIEVMGDSADSGMAYYNNWYLPVLPIDYPYEYSTIVFFPDTGEFYLLQSSLSPVFDTLSSTEFLSFASGDDVFYYKCYSGDSQWTYFKHNSGPFNCTLKTLCWSDVDILDKENNLYFAGSEPSSTQTITIEPDIYVGDLPDQIRDGEKDEENLNLPIIDPFKIIQSPETAYEDVTQTLQELKDGTITYDEYIEKVTADDPVVDPSGPTDPTDPTDDPEAIPEDMAPYIFDLRKIFPFCIPFDLYDFLTCLDAEPVAPVINWQLQLPGGSTYPITIDLSAFDSVAQLLRRLELLVFCIALGIKTRDLIKG